MFPVFVLGLLSFVVLANATSDLSASFRRSDTGITLVQCEIVRLTWIEGVPPYNVTVLDGLTVIESVTSRANSLGYMVTPGPGSQLSFVLVDSTGTTSAGGPFPVVAGSHAWCVRQLPSPLLPNPTSSSTSNSRMTSSTTALSSSSTTQYSPSTSSSPGSSWSPSPSPYSLSAVKPVPRGGHVSPVSEKVILVPKSYPAERVPDHPRSPWSSRYRQAAAPHPGAL